jgi:hypothetical protein
MFYTGPFWMRLQNDSRLALLALALTCGCDNGILVATRLAAAGSAGMGAAGVDGFGGNATSSAGNSGESAGGSSGASAGASAAGEAGELGVAGLGGDTGVGGAAGASGAAGGATVCVPNGAVLAACAGTPVLGELPEVGTGTLSPTAVASGDFNGDNKADLAIANTNAQLSLYLGAGNGLFQPSGSYAFGNTSLSQGFLQSIAVGFFDANTTLDVAVTNAGNGGQVSSTVSVLLGNGDGSLRAAVNYAVGFEPVSVITADFNADSKTDLAVANYTSGDVSVLLGNGDGTFKPALSDIGDANQYALAAGDFNGETKTDVAIASSGVVLAGLGQGNGKLAGNPFEQVGSSKSFPGSIVTADFNGDKKLDLAVTGGQAPNPAQNLINVLLGNGDGTFQLAVGYPVGAGPNSLAVADLNKDGKQDLLVTNTGVTAAAGDHVDVLLGKGDGTFQPFSAYGVATSPVSLTVADFDGDGVPDVATANGEVGNNFAVSADATVLHGNGDGSFESAPRYAVDPGSASVSQFVTAGDLNGDCLPDLVVNNPRPQGSNWVVRLSVLFGNADGSFQPPVDYSVSSTSGEPGAETIVIADFDSDHKMDLAVVTPVGLWTFKGNGDGTFQASVPEGNITQGMVAADFNADGRTDLASTGQVLLANGDGTFHLVAEPAITSQAPTVGHFDAGSSADLVSGNTLLLGNGDGTFATESLSNVPVSGLFGAADFNGDGKDDLIELSNTTTQVQLNNGNGTFQDPTPVPQAPEFGGALALLDFNGDGKVDVAIAKFESDTVALLLGHGDGSFEPEIDYAVGLGPASLAVADVGNRGRPSLIAINEIGGGVSVLSRTRCLP